MRTLIAFVTLALTGAFAQNSQVKHLDRFALQAHLKALGHKKRGGIPIATAQSTDARIRALPHFSSSFTVGGVTYPYTMLGYAPRSGATATLKSVIVPLRMNFLYFGANADISAVFEPFPAVAHILNSPIYQDALFPNGVGQFGDMMMRANFWNKMDAQHQWHVRMAPPRLIKTIDIEVTPETGSLSQLTDGTFIGDVLIDFMDSQIQTILQFANIQPDEVPIFVTDDVTAEALGYHSAGTITPGDGTQILQTYIFTSWLDPKEVDPLFADISTLNHEEAEWMTDPFINNTVPTWMYPPPTDPRTVCAFNPYLEVGDPQGNGPTYDDFPTYVISVNGVPYHLQQVVLIPWFADEKPSSAYNGWYTFPIPSNLTVPAAYCM